LGETEQKILEASEKYSRLSGYPLNPDKKIVEMIAKGLAANKKKYCYAYCPCRTVSGDKLADAKNICPCAFHRDEIKRDGYCKCRLFVSKDFAEKKKGGYL
jgi:ferredoxin-thioredoxin reductase catalytic subunit